MLTWNSITYQAPSHSDVFKWACNPCQFIQGETQKEDFEGSP